MDFLKRSFFQIRKFKNSKKAGRRLPYLLSNKYQIKKRKMIQKNCMQNRVRKMDIVFVYIFKLN